MKACDYFKGKVILITGASSGIGQDLALLLASYGTRLALVARRQALLDDLKSRCEQEGAEVQVYSADVTDREAMGRLANDVLERWRFVDIVVANAGVGGLNPADRFSVEINQKTMEINFFGLANTVAPFLPSMIEARKGQVVGISSLSAFRGLPNAASYCSAKAAQRIFLESLRVDLRPHGVAVTSIHPGFVVTPMTAHDDFPMPFMVPVRKSSQLIARAIMKRKSAYLYPWQMRWLTYLNRMLPDCVYDRLIPRLTAGKKVEEAKLL